MRIGIGHLIAGYGGNPYTADNIDVFDDLNWPPVDSGLVDRGMDLLTGLGFGLRGFHGLGDSCYQDPDTGVESCISDPTGLPVATSGGSSSGSCPGGVLDMFGNCQVTGGTVSTPTLTIPGTTTPAAGGGMTAAQIAALIAVSGNAAGTAIKATQTPYLIPGTNAIYNPQTGQIGSSTGLFNTTNLSSLSSMLPMLLLLGVGLFALSKLGGK